MRTPQPLGRGYSKPEEFENAAISVILDLCLRKTWAGKSRDYRDALIYEKLCSVSNRFSSTRKRKARFFQFLQFEERFRDGLVWTVGLTVELNKAVFWTGSCLIIEIAFTLG